VSRIDERRKHAQAEPSAEYAHKRAAIIEAAARVFQRNGYERASMNDVATEAGADRASVYYYFKGKHELFHAVIIDAVQHLVDSAERIAAADVPASEKVRELVAEYEVKPEADLIVIQDELDFPLGTLRIHTRRSSAGHNGIESIIGALGTRDFLRIRIGVAPERKVADGERYLLAPFRKAELAVVDGMLDTAAEAVTTILTEGAAAAMNRFNRKDSE